MSDGGEGNGANVGLWIAHGLTIVPIAVFSYYMAFPAAAYLFGDVAGWSQLAASAAAIHSVTYRVMATMVASVLAGKFAFVI